MYTESNYNPTTTRYDFDIKYSDALEKTAKVYSLQ